MSHEANRLEHEHPILLAQVDQLIKKLKVLVRDVQSVHKAKEDFRQFAEQLHAHEDAENRILKESFGNDFESTQLQWSRVRCFRTSVALSASAMQLIKNPNTMI